MTLRSVSPLGVPDRLEDFGSGRATQSGQGVGGTDAKITILVSFLTSQRYFEANMIII